MNHWADGLRILGWPPGSFEDTSNEVPRDHLALQGRAIVVHGDIDLAVSGGYFLDLDSKLLDAIEL